MLSDKTKLQIIFIYQSLGKIIAYYHSWLCSKGVYVVGSKIPVRSGYCSSFSLCLYVQISNKKQQISLTQSLLIALILQL